MENQNKKDFNKNQSQAEYQWSQKNAPHQDETTDGLNSQSESNHQDGGSQNQSGQMQNSEFDKANLQQNQASKPIDGPWSQDRNRGQSSISNMDQQRKGSDADYAASAPGTQNNSSRQQFTNPSQQQEGEVPNTNADL